jgi:hypothetical protein
MSNNYENDLQTGIADHMPFISELMQTEIVAFEYTDTKFDVAKEEAEAHDFLKIKNRKRKTGRWI